MCTWPTHNKAIKNRPQKAWAGFANARLLLRRYVYMLTDGEVFAICNLCK